MLIKEAHPRTTKIRTEPQRINIIAEFHRYRTFNIEGEN